MHFFDTHCHLQDERIKNDSKGIVDRAIAAGVKNMLCCGSTEDDWPEVIALSRNYPGIYAAVGLHPWYIASRSPHWLSSLEELLHSNPQLAIGEIGLDHALEAYNEIEQMTVFTEQLQLARKMKRPVSMHCRKAWGSLMALLRSGQISPTGLVIHSYSGPVELVKELESYGIMLSFSGSITYKRNHRGRAAAIAVSGNHLLIETDSPDISPVNHQGTNEPSTLPAVAQVLAQLRSVTIEEIAATTTATAQTLLGG
jgi:TatD DNase family protein